MSNNSPGLDIYERQIYLHVINTPYRICTFIEKPYKPQKPVTDRNTIRTDFLFIQGFTM